MDTMKTPEYTNVNAPETATVGEQRSVAMNVDQAGTLAKLPPASESTEQWKQIWEQISAFLSELPDYLGEFFSEYQRPLLTVGLILTGFVTVKVTLAVLDAINDIPLLAPVFELVGIGYSAWFIYRYLLQASTRKELATEITTIKSQVIGKGSSTNS